MHEMSIAEAILDQARRHTPPGGVLRSVTVLAGPLRGIDPEAMEFAWRGLTAEQGLDGVTLDLKSPPWTLLCPACGGRYESATVDAACPCGGAGTPVGGDELLLLSLDVDVPGQEGE